MALLADEVEPVSSEQHLPSDDAEALKNKPGVCFNPILEVVLECDLRPADPLR
jgi:hypothetical protein